MADLTIKDVREKYPQYHDMSDQQLVEGLHKSHYADMPFDQFASKVGYNTAPIDPETKQPIDPSIPTKAVLHPAGSKPYQEPPMTLGKLWDASKLEGLDPALQLGPIGMPKLAKLAGDVVEKLPKMVSSGAKSVIESPEVHAIGKMLPKMSKDTGEMVRKAEKIGIQVPPDMLTDNRLLKVFGSAFREIPLSGSVTENNRIAFNKAIIETIDGDRNATKFTPQLFNEAMNRHGETIGNISSKYPINVEKDLSAKLGEVESSLSKETPDVARVITGYLRDIDGKVVNGKINGEVFRKIRTEIGTQMRSTGNGDLKRALSDLDEHMLDAIEKNLTKDELKEFTEARHFYYNGKVIEPLVAKAAIKAEGNMSPAAYANQLLSSKSRKASIARGKGGLPAEIAEIGSKFLTEPSASGLTEKGIALSTMLGSGLIGNVPGALGAWGGANVYNRLSPYIVKLLARK